MFQLDACFGATNPWEDALKTVTSLIAMAWVIAMLLDYFQKLWTPESDSTESSQKGPGSHRDRIVSPQRTYELREQVGSGDLCDVHLASAGDSQYLLKIPRPGGEALLSKEFSILEKLHSQSSDPVCREYFPWPVESFSNGARAINAYRWRDGFYSAEQILDRHHRGLDGRHLGWMFNRMLEALGTVHRQGFVHGAVLPSHVLFHAENHGLLLVGWIHAERLNTSLKVAPERFKEWYPPECRKKLPATPSVDIYLAAKTLIYLAGGDPVLETFPDHVPVNMQRFLKSCLLESPSMRCQDAWDVRHDFGNILEGLFGPPAFHPLDMSY